MQLRGMLSKTEIGILEKSKELRYSDEAYRVHKGFEFGQIAKEYTGTPQELAQIIKSENLSSTAGRSETTLRVSGEVNALISSVAEEIGVSKIAVVRALLWDRQRQMETNNDEKNSLQSAKQEALRYFKQYLEQRHIPYTVETLGGEIRLIL